MKRILIAVILLICLVVLSSCGVKSGDEMFSGRFIAIENIAADSWLMFDPKTDLVYVVTYGPYRMGFSPYYIVDESNTQRIAMYPKDLEYLIDE